MRKTTSICRGSLLRLALEKKKPLTGDPEIEKRNGEIDKARKQLLLYIGVPLISILCVASLITLVCNFIAPFSTIYAAEGELALSVPAEKALCDYVSPGDVVRFYDQDGPIPALRYVRVKSVSQDSLLLLVTQEQLEVYLALEDNFTFVPVISGNAAAEQAIQQQRQWNNPTVSLSFGTAELALSVGQSYRMEYTMGLEPADATQPQLVWESSDPSVLSVDQNGLVTAHNIGKVTLTLSAGDASASCAVTVTVPADSLAFDQESYQVSVGKTLFLPLTALPEGASESYTWESSDTAIATVGADGTVTGVAPGSATITVTGVKATASCTVTVTVPPERIVLSQEELSLNVGSTQPLAAVVMPENATDKQVTWESSDTAIVTVGADGTVTAVAPGSATVTVRCGEVTASCTVTVTAPEPPEKK